MTALTNPTGGIEIDDLPGFQRREWAAQRLGWVLMLLVVLAGSAGAFGRGPLASASAGTADGRLQVRYERTLRHRAPTTLWLDVAPGVAREGRVRLEIGREYLADAELARVVPEPESVETTGDGIVLTFRAGDPLRPAAIMLDVEPESYGTLRGRFALAGDAPLRLEQFVFP